MRRTSRRTPRLRRGGRGGRRLLAGLTLTPVSARVSSRPSPCAASAGSTATSSPFLSLLPLLTALLLRWLTAVSCLEGWALPPARPRPRRHRGRVPAHHRQGEGHATAGDIAPDAEDSPSGRQVRGEPAGQEPETDPPQDVVVALRLATPPRCPAPASRQDGLRLRPAGGLPGPRTWPGRLAPIERRDGRLDVLVGRGRRGHPLDRPAPALELFGVGRELPHRPEGVLRRRGRHAGASSSTIVANRAPMIWYACALQMSSSSRQYSLNELAFALYSPPRRSGQDAARPPVGRRPPARPQFVGELLEVQALARRRRHDVPRWTMW